MEGTADGEPWTPVPTTDAAVPLSPPPAPLEPMLQFFEYQHLPEHLRAVSAPFGQLAHKMVQTLPRNPERSAGLRKLLEAKDCAVRALLYRES